MHFMRGILYSDLYLHPLLSHVRCLHCLRLCFGASLGCIEDAQVASPFTVCPQIVRQLRVHSADGVGGFFTDLDLCHRSLSIPFQWNAMPWPGASPVETCHSGAEFKTL